MDVVLYDMGEDDPFTCIDSNADLQGLIADIMPETETCNTHEYVNGDDDLSTCKDKKWDTATAAGKCLRIFNFLMLFSIRQRSTPPLKSHCERGGPVVQCEEDYYTYLLQDQHVC